MTPRCVIAAVLAACGGVGSFEHTLAQQSAARPDAAAIHGLVLDDQRQPIDRAVIGLTGTDTPWKRTVISGPDGSFDVIDVPLTGVMLVASRPGFVTMAYGAKRVGQFGPVVRLAAGERKSLTLVLNRTAAITGVVRDAEGEPVVGLQVSAQASTTDHNSPGIYRGAAAVTDRRGEYRIFGLPPGAYVVVASKPGEDLHQFDVHGVEHVSSYVQTYFPATTRVDEATLVTVGAGGTADGINFALRPWPSTQVTGEIQLPPGEVFTNAMVRITPEGQDERGGFSLSIYSRDPKFVFRGITQGRYTVSARANLRVPAGTAAPARPQTVWGVESIAVDGSTPVAITLSLDHGFTVTGQIVYESTAPGDLQRRGIVLRAVGGPFTNVASFVDGSIGADGRFTIHDVPRSTYTLEVQGPTQAEWSMKSVVVGGVDVLDTPLEVAQDVSGVVATMTNRQTGIEGTVIGRDGQPSADVLVIVYAADRQYWTLRSRRVRAVPPDTRGGFTLRGLPEGTYLVAATDVDIADGVDPAALERLRPVSVPIMLKLGEMTSVTVKVR